MNFYKTERPHETLKYKTPQQKGAEYARSATTFDDIYLELSGSNYYGCFRPEGMLIPLHWDSREVGMAFTPSRRAYRPNLNKHNFFFLLYGKFLTNESQYNERLKQKR